MKDPDSSVNYSAERKAAKELDRSGTGSDQGETAADYRVYLGLPRCGFIDVPAVLLPSHAV